MLRAFLCVLALAVPTGAAFAAEAPTLLTVTADFDGDGAVEDRAYTQEALETLGETRFTTNTTWTKGPQEFRGVLLDKILQDAKMTSGTLVLTAANDYAITVPLAEIAGQPALLAFERNGAPMALRDKGPIWLVFPYDSADSFRNEVVYSRSVWQLVRISQKP